MARTPREAGFAQPAEWSPHDACWLAFPYRAEDWLEDLPPAREEFAALCRAIADVDPSGTPRERLEILVRDDATEAAARSLLGDLPARYHRMTYGDSWTRDTAPIFLTGPGGEVGAVRFSFNGWGGKYEMPGDREVAASIATFTKVPTFVFPHVLEGGALEVDGEGTCMTTRACVVDARRNPGKSASELDALLRDALGVETVLWFDATLLHDHTDGHIDTLARFVRPGVVVCMEARQEDDPNRPALAQLARELEQAVDARGRRLEVVRIPSPGKVLDATGRLMPASYANFYIANSTVIVPTYGSPYDDEAVEAIATLFPTRRTVGLSARSILTGGGAFHCITQQQPSPGGDGREGTP